MNDSANRRRRPAELRGRLLDAGRDLFAEQGYPATTQRQIASAAGVSPSVLFRNFGSKSQLLIEAVVDPFGAFVSDVYSALDLTGGDRQSLARGVIEDLQRRLGTHRLSLRALLTTLQSTDGDVVMRETGARMDTLFDRLAPMLETSRGASEGAIGSSELALRLLVGTITTMVVLDDWFLPRAPRPRQRQLADLLASMTAAFSDDHGTVSVSSAPPPESDRTATPKNTTAGRERNGRRPTDEVRQSLLTAATRLFVERGYSATSYRDIAIAAATSESALYRHFGSKSSLLTEAVLQPFTSDFEAVSRRWALTPPDSRRARQPEFVGELYAVLARHRKPLRTLMGLANDPQHAELHAATAAWFARTFTELTAVSVHRARTENASLYEPELRIRAVMAMVLAAVALDDWFMPRDERAVQPGQVIPAVSALITSARTLS